MTLVVDSTSTVENLLTSLGRGWMTVLQKPGFDYDVRVKMYLDSGAITIPSSEIENGRDILASISPISGRELEGFEGRPSSCSCTLKFDNTLGTFDRENRHSPFYGQTLATRRIEIQMLPRAHGQGLYSSTEYPVFLGFMWEPEFDSDFVSIQCYSLDIALLTTEAILRQGPLLALLEQTSRKRGVGELQAAQKPTAAATNSGNGSIDLIALNPWRIRDTQSIRLEFTGPHDFNVTFTDSEGNEVEHRAGNLESLIWDKDIDNSYADPETGSPKYRKTQKLRIGIRWEKNQRIWNLYDNLGCFRNGDITIGLTGRLFGGKNTRFLMGYWNHLQPGAQAWNIGYMESSLVPDEWDILESDMPEHVVTGEDGTAFEAAIRGRQPFDKKIPGTSTTVSIIPGGSTHNTGSPFRQNIMGTELQEGVHFVWHYGRPAIERLGSLDAGSYWILELSFQGPVWYSDGDELGIEIKQGLRPFMAGDAWEWELKPQCALGEWRTYLRDLIDDSQTQIQVMHPGTVLVGDTLQIEDELLLVTDKTSGPVTMKDLDAGTAINAWIFLGGSANPRPWNQEWQRSILTVARAQGGTSAAQHAQDTLVQNLTATGAYDDAGAETSTLDTRKPEVQTQALLTNTEWGIGQTADTIGFQASDLDLTSFTEAGAEYERLGITLRHAYTGLDEEHDAQTILEQILQPCNSFLSLSRNGKYRLIPRRYTSPAEELPTFEDQDAHSLSIEPDKSAMFNSIRLTFGNNEHEGNAQTIELTRTDSVAKYRQFIQKEYTWKALEDPAVARLCAEIQLARGAIIPDEIPVTAAIQDLLEIENGDRVRMTTRVGLGAWAAKPVLAFSEDLDLGQGMISRVFQRDNLVDLRPGLWASNMEGIYRRAYLAAAIATTDETEIQILGPEYIGCPTYTEYTGGTSRPQTIQIESEKMTALWWKTATEAGTDYPVLKVVRGILGTTPVTHALTTALTALQANTAARDALFHPATGDSVQMNDLLLVDSVEAIQIQSVNADGSVAVGKREFDSVTQDGEQAGTVSGGLATADTTFTITDPHARGVLYGDILRAEQGSDIEYMEVLDVAGGTYTVRRGLYQTVPLDTGSDISLYWHRPQHLAGATLARFQAIAVLTNVEGIAEATGDDLLNHWWAWTTDTKYYETQWAY